MGNLVYSDDNGNKVYGEPLKVIGSYKFSFLGKNSLIVIGEKCVFKNVVIQVKGDNNVVNIGDGCQVFGKILTTHSDSKIIIGNYLKCNAACRFHAAEGRTITIGDHCLFSNVRFRTSDSHSIISLETQSRINAAADITIENKVWIAEDVYIYKGITVGTGSIVGARSTVTKSLPANSVCVGSPAVAIKQGVTWSDKLI